MAIFAYARSGSANVKLSDQLASLKKAGCSDIMIDRTYGRHPRDLRRRAALLERLQAGDTVMVYRLDCLAVSGGDLVLTIARIRSRSAVLRTTDADSPNEFCNDTIDAITSAFVTFANSASAEDDGGHRTAGRSVILTSADWPQVQKDCEMMTATAVAKRHNVSRSTLYNFIARMRRNTDMPATFSERS